MPKPRFSGGKRSMRRSSSKMLPPVSDNNPAMQLSAVVLPQPEGPSRQMNSPRLMTSDNSRSAATCAPAGAPKERVTLARRSSRKEEVMSDQAEEQTSGSWPMFFGD